MVAQTVRQDTVWAAVSQRIADPGEHDQAVEQMAAVVTAAGQMQI
jgi:hypothetical protein